MIVYSVTIKVELEIHNDWLDWMKKVHIPDVMKTKKFVDYKMHRILAEEEQSGITYNVQYRAASMTDYFDYQNDFAPKLQAAHTERYKDKFVGFRTLLKEV
ncbi:MAG: DUF4286 family protein [Chitinophagales bacterium]